MGQEEKNRLSYHFPMILITGMVSHLIIVEGRGIWSLVLALAWILILVISLGLETFKIKAVYTTQPSGFFEWFYIFLLGAIPPIFLATALHRICKTEKA